MSAANDPDGFRRTVRRTLEIEGRGLAALADALDGVLGAALAPALAALSRPQGRIVVSGMGKSGHVARKVAATLASTGTPAIFLHPAEASHGDLGMITRADAILALSWSGETPEFRDLTTYAGRFGIPLVAMTSREGSALARAADHVLLLPQAEEACPNGLAPTTSTTMQLALGDALAMALLERRGFTPEHFRIFHPGGRLGAQLVRVADLMRAAPDLPIVSPETALREAVFAISAGRLGCAVVIGADGRLAGLVTDGDVRRAFGDGRTDIPVGPVMSRAPHVVPPTLLASEALRRMNELKVSSLVVVEGDAVAGVIHVQEILSSGVA